MKGLENWTIFMDVMFLSSLIPDLFCYNSVDMRVNLGAVFVLILSYLVSKRRALKLSEYKLENLFSFTCLI